MTDESTEEQPEFDCEGTDECVCPHCGYEETDSWEIGAGREEDGETECSSCGKPYAYSRHVRVTYSTEKLKEKAKP